MKICVISEFSVPYYNGGGEHRYYEIMKRVVSQGHSVDMITMNYPNCPKHETYDGINIHHIGPIIENPPIRSKTDFMKFFFSVCNWLRKNNYDILDAQAYSPLLSATLMSKITKTPIVGVVHDTSTNNNDQWVQSSTLANKAETFLVNLPFDVLLTVSNPTKQSLINDFGVDSNRIEILYNGCDIELMDSVECNQKDENTILFIGRLIPHKHVDHLINSVNNLKNEIPNIHLNIIGRGIEKDNLLNQIKENNLEKHVSFMQDLSQEELIYQIKKSNVLVLPSTREGFGMVLAEANCCSIPVISYIAGGTTDVIDDGKTGFLVETENQKELTEKIKKVLTDKDLQKKLGDNGRQKVENEFNWNKLVKEYISMLEKIIQEYKK